MNLENGDPKPSTPEQRSMNEAETLAFFMEKGIQPLSLDVWQAQNPHPPILYIIPEDIREGGPMGYFPANKMPSVARLDCVVGIVEETDLDLQQGVTTYRLSNAGGQIDYFAINSATGKIAPVRTSKKRKNYYTTLKHLFTHDDDLFKKSEII